MAWCYAVACATNAKQARWRRLQWGRAKLDCVRGNVARVTLQKMVETPLPQPADFPPLGDPEAHGVRISTLNELAATLSAILPNTQHVSKTS